MITAVFLPAVSYRHMTPHASWLRDGVDLAADLRDALRDEYDADVVRLRPGVMHSPGSVQRAIASQVFEAGGPVVIGLAGCVEAFQRSSGDFHTLALPGSVPRRPGSSLSFGDLARALINSGDREILLVADLQMGEGERPVPVAQIADEMAAVLGGRISVLIGSEGTCHAALAAVLEEIADAGHDAVLGEIIKQAADVGGERRLGSACAVVSPRAGVTTVVPAPAARLPELIREDLYAANPGSRIDAAVELAVLAAEGNQFAAKRLRRLARADPDARVRGDADGLLRGTEQPTLPDLQRSGRLPVRPLTLDDPAAVPDLIPQPFRAAIIGSEAGQPANRPRHRVEIAPFSLGRIPVTNRQFLAFVAAEGGPCPDNWATEPGLWEHPDLPVVWVTFYDALRYCRWLDEGLHHRGLLAADLRITLPSEAEWEAAAGNGRGEAFPWGDEDRPAARNLRPEGAGAVVPSGLHSPTGDSESGCCDMVGNCWEWTRSLWGVGQRNPTYEYPYIPDDGREDLEADSSVRRVIRGGGFYYSTRCGNTFTRNNLRPTCRHRGGTFRVAAVPVL